MIGRLAIVAVMLAAPLGAQQAQKAAPPAPRQQDSKTQGATKAADTKAPARQGALPTAGEGTAGARVPVILREVYTYASEGRRDPFVTLLSSEELRPSVADLRLVAVLIDPRRPIAIMRDLTTNEQYRVTTGMKIGRMTVALIKRRAVIFSIEEFGLNRTDSLVLGDTTKARAK